MRVSLKRSIISTFIAAGMLTQSYASSCDELKKEIQSISDLQEEQIKIPHIGHKEGQPNPEMMTMKEAKKNRDKDLARAFALQALLHIKKDYDNLEKALSKEIKIEDLLNDQEIEMKKEGEETTKISPKSLFKNAEENLEKVYKYGLLRNYTNMMALEQALDSTYENRMDTRNIFQRMDAPSTDIKEYMENCERRIGKYVGYKIGIKDNLEEAVELDSSVQGEVTQIIDHHSKICSQTQELRNALNDKSSAGIKTNVDQALSNMSDLYKRSGAFEGYEKLRNEGKEEGAWATTVPQIKEHADLLNGFKVKVIVEKDGKKETKIYRNPLEKMMAESNDGAFERSYNTAFGIFKSADPENNALAEMYKKTDDELRKNEKLGASELTKYKRPTEDQYNNFSDALATIKNLCIQNKESKKRVSFDECQANSKGQEITNAKEKVAEYLNAIKGYGENGPLKADNVFNFDNNSRKEFEDTENKKYADAVTKRMDDLLNKIGNLNLRNRLEGDNKLDKDTDISALINDIPGLKTCLKIKKTNPINPQLASMSLDQKKDIGRCLESTLDSNFVEDQLKGLKDNIQTYDDRIAEAARKDKKFKDLEKLKFIAKINYSHSCKNDDEKNQSLSLISPGDKCLAKHLDGVTSTKITGRKTLCGGYRSFKIL